MCQLCIWNSRNSLCENGSGFNECADGFASDGAGDVAGFFEVEDVDGDFVGAAEVESGGIHDGEVFFDGLIEGERFVFYGIVVDVGVFVVNAVDFGGFHDDFGIEFDGAECGGGVGGEEGVAGAGAEDDDAAFFEVTDGAAEDEGFGDGGEVDGGEYACGLAEFFEHFFDGECVDGGAEHAHAVCGGLRDEAILGECGAADDVATADDDGDLDASLSGCEDFSADGLEFVSVNAASAGFAETFS